MNITLIFCEVFFLYFVWVFAFLSHDDERWKISVTEVCAVVSIMVLKTNFRIFHISYYIQIFRYWLNTTFPTPLEGGGTI